MFIVLVDWCSFPVCLWVSSVARSCSTKDDNVCKPNIPAGINCPPPSKTISPITWFGTISTGFLYANLDHSRSQKIETKNGLGPFSYQYFRSHKNWPNAPRVCTSLYLRGMQFVQESTCGGARFVELRSTGSRVQVTRGRCTVSLACGRCMYLLAR